MDQTPTVSLEDALKYIASWKAELDLRQKELNSRLLSGAMGGVATIVLSAGLALDKLHEAGWLVRCTLGLAVLLLLLGAGNIMNCFAVAVNGQLRLLQTERALAVAATDVVPLTDLRAIDDELGKAVSVVQRNYGYSYYCIVLAVVAGAITFFITLVRG